MTALNTQIALQTTARILACFAVVQAYEFLKLSAVTKPFGVWTWKDLRPEIGPAFGLFLSTQGFFILNILRVCVAIVVAFHPAWYGVTGLLLIHVLTMIRWRGTFNGGSDYMNSLLLVFTTLGLFAPDRAGIFCLAYIAFQTCRSYFKAGWVKLKNPKWRSGQALRDFLNSPLYEKNELIAKFTGFELLTQLASWFVIFFELTFTLSLLDRRMLATYMFCGLSFHLLNSYAFGLNRFVLAWLGAYPALIFCASAIASLIPI